MMLGLVSSRNTKFVLTRWEFIRVFVEFVFFQLIFSPYLVSPIYTPSHYYHIQRGTSSIRQLDLNGSSAKITPRERYDPE